MNNLVQRVTARYQKLGQASTFDWRSFGSELKRALSSTGVPPKAVTGSEFPAIIGIDLQFGRDYFENPHWSDKIVKDVINSIAKKHGLVHAKSGKFGFFTTPDGKTIEVGVMADSFGGSSERLASLDTESILDGMDKRTGLRRINAVIAGAHLGGIFRDRHWAPIQKLWQKFEDEGIPILRKDSFYSMDDHGNPNAKTWKFTVEWQIPNGRPVIVYGQVVASGAGSVNDPLDAYDVVAYAN